MNSSNTNKLYHVIASHNVKKNIISKFSKREDLVSTKADKEVILDVKDYIDKADEKLKDGKELLQKNQP